MSSTACKGLLSSFSVQLIEIYSFFKDFNTAKQRVADRVLDGSSLSIERVPVCSSIMVSGLSTKTSHDGLENYFSLPRIGGDVSKIEFKKGDDHAIVTFEDSTGKF